MKTDLKLFETAFKYASIGMALVTPDGIIQKSNPSFAKLLGHSHEEIVGLNFRDITYPEDIHQDEELCFELLRGERESFQMEKRYFHKNGNIIWAILSVSLLRDEKGRPELFISQIQDITQLKLLQYEAQVNVRKATQYEMSVGMAHEINNPLTIIELNAKVLEDFLKNEEKNYSLMLNFASKIRETSARIDAIVKKFKGVSRPSVTLGSDIDAGR